MLLLATIVPREDATASYVLPGSTVRDLKVSVSERFGDPGEIRLSVNNAHLLTGPLFPQVGGQKFTVQVTHVPVDPLRKSLLVHAGYVDWNEQDECMAKMLTRRLPNRCFCGLTKNELPEVSAEHRNRRDTCYQCNFSFWGNSDSGWTPTLGLDPYSMLLDEAIRTAKTVEKCLAMCGVLYVEFRLDPHLLPMLGDN
jgi:hypothetical protein